jgi:hypothetical protein
MTGRGKVRACAAVCERGIEQQMLYIELDNMERRETGRGKERDTYRDRDKRLKREI